MTLGHSNWTILNEQNILSDINKTDENRRTPLSNAAKKGHLDVLKLLLDSGAEPNAAGRFWLAAREGNGKEVARLLDSGMEKINRKFWEFDHSTALGLATTRMWSNSSSTEALIPTLEGIILRVHFIKPQRGAR